MTTTNTNISRTTAIRIWSDATDRGTIIVSRDEGGSSYTILSTDDYSEALAAGQDAAARYGVDLLDEVA